MDTITSWLHNANIDRTLERLGAYLDPSIRLSLLNRLIEQKAELADNSTQLDHTARRIREGRVRLDRTASIIDGLIDNRLMDQETFSKAFAVFTTLHDSLVLLEQHHRLMSESLALEARLSRQNPQ